MVFPLNSSTQRYCGIEDEVFFMKTHPLASLWDVVGKRKKRRIILDDILQKAPPSDCFYRGLSNSFWRRDGGLIYAESTASEFCTPLIEVQPDCIETLVDSILAQRSVMVQMKDEVQSLGKSCVVEGWSTHYNFGLDPLIRGENLNSVSRQFIIDRRPVQWSKYSSDLIRVLIKTLGPAYFVLLEDDTSRGFMYRFRDEDRFELCGDFMPDVDQLHAGLAFLFGTVRGVEEKIKELVLGKGTSTSTKKETYSRISEEEILDIMPFVFDSITYREIQSKTGFGVDRETDKLLAREGTTACFTERSGKVYSALDIVAAYAEYFWDHIAAYATPKQCSLLKKIIDGNHTLNVDIKGPPPFYYDLNTTYIEESTVKNWKMGIGEHPPHEGVAQAYAYFVQHPRVKQQGFTLETEQMTWSGLSFIIYDEKEKQSVYVPRERGYEFYHQIISGNLLGAINTYSTLPFSP